MEKHKWVDGFGREFESEVVARFDRGEFEWVTCWVDHADEFRTFVAGPKQLKGREALAACDEPWAREFWEMEVETAGDMSSREIAESAVMNMTLADMKAEYDDLMQEDLGDDPLGDWHGRNE